MTFYKIRILHYNKKVTDRNAIYNIFCLMELRFDNPEPLILQLYNMSVYFLSIQIAENDTSV